MSMRENDSFGQVHGGIYADASVCMIFTPITQKREELAEKLKGG